ncbi:hypothetical protein [Nonomuraea typhae]|uniref:DUF3072 domain-containing protein n=1 Tax=Nonomuraea typhae TaxID=2603600 RepID=A0ABW7YM19_9ACTN
MSTDNQPSTPNTISDEKWQRLQDKARKANPTHDSFTDPEAIRLRKQYGEQLKKRKWS